MSAVMKEPTKTEPLLVTKARLKEWSACTDGFQWFVKKFPQGAPFGEV
jgi:hypothetical protein